MSGQSPNGATSGDVAGAWHVRAASAKGLRGVAQLTKGVVDSSELLLFLTLRDVKVRYQQAVIGAAWAVLQPMLMTAAFVVIFTRVTSPPVDDTPYLSFALTGLIPWTLFANAVGTASQAVVNNSQLVTKVYFPRALLPLSGVLSYVPDALVATLVMIPVLALQGIALTPRLLALPVAIAIVALAAVAGSLGLAALNVAYRDVRYAVPFTLQLVLFLSPVAYAADTTSGVLRVVMALNPMSAPIAAFRWAALGRVPEATVPIASASVLLLLLVGGAAYFNRTEPHFADVI